jgi:hypothetical protein
MNYEEVRMECLRMAYGLKQTEGINIDETLYNIFASAIALSDYVTKGEICNIPCIAKHAKN